MPMQPTAAGWLYAYRFEDPQRSVSAYEALRDLIAAEDLDATVLRFTLDDSPHVALLGERTLPDESSPRVAACFDYGKIAEIPDWAAEDLRERRLAVKASGVRYVEVRRSTDAGQ